MRYVPKEFDSVLLSVEEIENGGDFSISGVRKSKKGIDFLKILKIFSGFQIELHVQLYRTCH